MSPKINGFDAIVANFSYLRRFPWAEFELRRKSLVTDKLTTLEAQLMGYPPKVQQKMKVPASNLNLWIMWINLCITVLWELCAVEILKEICCICRKTGVINLGVRRHERNFMGESAARRKDEAENLLCPRRTQRAGHRRHGAARC